ncbi:hypothetical protein [Hyphomicrobium sp.]|uniref:hypothetical protein n=1 Tax=Hyphomicrobium sp. TaxID=82 RepID=UPI001D542075|nr:hypothetical protein [Hyphomicrobium sp.]MBY0558501.1 hypothetical protein [Hyphomicrobium sp.]
MTVRTKNKSTKFDVDKPSTALRFCVRVRALLGVNEFETAMAVLSHAITQRRGEYRRRQHDGEHEARHETE